MAGTVLSILQMMIHLIVVTNWWGLPQWLGGRVHLPLQVDIRDVGSIPGSGRSPAGGHGNALRYSCLENPMDRGAWQATVHGDAESDTTEPT